MARKKIGYVPLAKELKKHIEIMDSTFTAFNLQVINVGCKPYSEDDGDLNVYVEIASVTGSEIPCTLDVKINLYDDNDELYMTEMASVFRKRFNGYDTVTIRCDDDSHTLEKAVKGRLYATKSHYGDYDG